MKDKDWEVGQAGEESEVTLAQTKQETDEKCEQCGGTMDFDPQSGGLLCPYCGHTQEIRHDEEDALYAQELDFQSAEETGNHDWGIEVKTVICKSCGAESVYDALQISGECPYCGSNQVMEERANDSLAPNGVCPFRVDAKTAGERFTSWIRKKWFCPSLAKKKAKPKSFFGVYLPYWTFDAQTDSLYSGRYGIDRTVKTKNGTRTVTDWYSTSGSYSTFIDDQLVCGTDKHEDSMLRKIEPFDTKNSVQYKPEYVAGFVAERYSTGLKSAWEKAKAFIQSRLESEIEHKIRSEKHADRADVSSLKTAYSRITYKYLLLPVWLSSFTYKDKVYQFIVNGQTGKVGGKSPVSPLRVMLAVLIGCLILGLIYWVVSNS